MVLRGELHSIDIDSLHSIDSPSGTSIMQNWFSDVGPNGRGCADLGANLKRGTASQGSESPA